MKYFGDMATIHTRPGTPVADASGILNFGFAGALEDEIVATLALLVWRKQNLASFQIAKDAQQYYNNITREKGADWTIMDSRYLISRYLDSRPAILRKSKLPNKPRCNRPARTSGGRMSSSSLARSRPSIG